ncbi:MAG: PQQ-binding-like beta-propeller repeat protein [Candidatus Bathyarchaeota archaeon]|nr:PQQ-binding-like beta-propeller repeat protein [Candidatus Bathyarchaeota archaeon]
MKISRNISKLSTISMILLITISAILVTLPTISAHDPAWTVPSFLYLTAQPDPIGVNQEAFLVWWTAEPPPGAAGVGGMRWTDMRLSVITPDGQNQSLGTFTSEPTGGNFFLYTPTQVGTYTFGITMPEQLVTDTHPETGIPGSGSSYIGDYFTAAEAIATLEVVAEPLEKHPDYPLPTEYWDRPIEGQNAAWSQVASNWLGMTLMQGYRVQDYGAGPNSAHIMWTKSFESGGVVGDGGTAWGEGYAIHGATYYEGMSYETRFGNVIILNGRIYFSPPLANNAGGGPYTCMDLRTGEIIWQREGIAPRFGQLYDYESMNQHGVIPSGVLFQVSGSTWRAYDAWTGNNLYNLTGVPRGTEVVTDLGEIDLYILDDDENTLSCWTTAAFPDSDLVRTPGTSSNAYQYRPVGKEVDMSDNYRWIVDIPDLPGSSSPSIVSVIPGDLILGRSSSLSTTSSWRGTSDPFTIWALNLDESRGEIGELYWIRDYHAPAGNMTQMFNYQPVDPVNRAFQMTIFETGQRLGYSLDTGELLWGPVMTPYMDADGEAFQYFSSRAGQIAYGNLYVGGYGGITTAIAMDDGEILWEFDDTSSAYETPWGRYPNHISMFADGKIYLFSGEHSPNIPPYKGARTWCLDAITGEELWNLQSWSASGLGEAMANAYIADGYLVFNNLYTNEITCIGKGPSALTLDVQDSVVAKGESVMITGRVTDISAGTKQTEQAARFPNGVPAVSDESMGQWMEYVYLQKPRPDDATGVPLKLAYLTSDGTWQDIDQVTSDDYGNFGFKWTPPDEGTYVVKAFFLGSESYWGSSDTTHVGVSSAQVIPEPQEVDLTSLEEGQSNLTMYVLVTLVIVIIALLIAIYSLLKKQK